MLQGELYQWKILVTQSGIKLASFRLAAQCLNQMRHRVPHYQLRLWPNFGATMPAACVKMLNSILNKGQHGLEQDDCRDFLLVVWMSKKPQSCWWRKERENRSEHKWRDKKFKNLIVFTLWRSLYNGDQVVAVDGIFNFQLVCLQVSLGGGTDTRKERDLKVGESPSTV